jgi:phosphoribosylanthranilate isomerase
MSTDAQNNRVRVKVCGLTSLEDARFASGALADFLGFVFYEESPRYIDPAKAGAIINWIEGPLTVGVFVNHALDDVNMIASQSGLDIVQLHGNESPEYCRLIEKPVIKVFRVNDETDPDSLRGEVELYLEDVDYLLFDTKSESAWGGTGKTFDWSLIKDLSVDLPVFLSGGLNPDNVKKACRTVQPWGIDLSSGLESSPGLKDFDKLEQLFDRMREVEEEIEQGRLSNGQ